MHTHRIGPLSGWVDDHLFACIPHHHIEGYNVKCKQWFRTLLAGVDTNKEVVFGLEVTSVMMEHLRNLMKTAISHAWTYLTFPLTLSRTCMSLTTSMTLTKYLANLASPGISPKTSSLVTQQLILVSHGIYPPPWYPSAWLRSQSTFSQLWNGRPVWPTFSRMLKNYTASSFMAAHSFHMGVPTSLT